MNSKTCANKKCKHGGVFLNPAMHFNSNKSRKDELHPYCKYCSREDSRYYYTPTPKKEVTCAYSQCTNTFLTNTNKTYCCESHKYKAYIERKGRQSVNHLSKLAKRKRRASFKDAANNNKTWTGEEITAMHLRIDGLTWAEIAKKLKRSESAVFKKVKPLVDQFKMKASSKIIS